MSIVFETGKVNGRQSLPISNSAVRSLIENLIDDPKINPDKRFVYYLLGATGICLVPLSSFNTDLQGFRMTLLEPDEQQFCDMIDTLGKGIEDYINSAE